MAETLTPGAYWIPPGGVVERYLARAYAGDGAGNRVIALGAVYDYVEVIETTAGGSGSTTDYRARSWADGQADILWAVAGAFTFTGGGFAASAWQGFQTGRTEIKLGSTAGLATNTAGRDYLIRAWKYSKIEA